MNEEARDASLALAQGAIRLFAESDARAVGYFASANEAYRADSRDIDQSWANRSLGAAAARSFGLAGTLIIKPRNTIGFAWWSESLERRAVPAAFLGPLTQIVTLARVDSTGEVWQDYVTLGGEVFLASTARVRGSSPSQGPVIVILRALGASVLARLDAEYSLQRMAVLDALHPADGREMSLELRTVTGETAATLAWSRVWPGDQFAQSYGAPTLAVILGLLTFTMFGFLRLERSKTALSALNRRLRERESEAQAARHAAEEAERAKTNFLANMSHELRTPLNAIMGFSELLETQLYGPINQRQAEYLKDIHQSGSHLLDIINDILDMARLGAGRYKIEPERIDLSALVDECLRLVAVRAEQAQVALVNNIIADLPDLLVDRRAIKQLVINLLSNAVKFSPAGGEVRVGASLASDGSVVICVADNGPGVSADAIDQLFQPFAQGDSAPTKKHEGTGLGLAISRELMQLHGGSLVLLSDPDQGTRALARFPKERLAHGDAPDGSPTPQGDAGNSVMFMAM